MFYPSITQLSNCINNQRALCIHTSVDLILFQLYLKGGLNLYTNQILCKYRATTIKLSLAHCVSRGGGGASAIQNKLYN